MRNDYYFEVLRQGCRRNAFDAHTHTHICISATLNNQAQSIRIYMHIMIIALTHTQEKSQILISKDSNLQSYARNRLALDTRRISPNVPPGRGRGIDSELVHGRTRTQRDRLMIRRRHRDAKGVPTLRRPQRRLAGSPCRSHAAEHAPPRPLSEASGPRRPAPSTPVRAPRG